MKLNELEKVAIIFIIMVLGCLLVEYMGWCK